MGLSLRPPSLRLSSAFFGRSSCHLGLVVAGLGPRFGEGPCGYAHDGRCDWPTCIGQLVAAALPEALVFFGVGLLGLPQDLADAAVVLLVRLAK